ncbi:MAG: DUF2383 domain-containing protein [Clostridium celatum]|nr:DUF2383 domain-containing protein [Clostridium celatum]MDU4979962.1 DUF2383 domain-containing protein [Clostridium celatum]
MSEKIIKELNKFLTGIHMGGATFKEYLDKAQNLELKSSLREIIESFKRHEEAITHRIEELGGNASDSLGIRGNIAEVFEKIKLISVDTDAEVCEHAIKAMNMGIKNTNKFMEEHKNMEESLMNDIKGVIKDYDDQLEVLNNLKTKLCKY